MTVLRLSSFAVKGDGIGSLGNRTSSNYTAAHGRWSLGRGRVFMSGCL